MEFRPPSHSCFSAERSNWRDWRRLAVSPFSTYGNDLTDVNNGHGVHKRTVIDSKTCLFCTCSSGYEQASEEVGEGRGRRSL